MAKILDLTESTYKIITDYANSIGIKRATEQSITKLGFGAEVTVRNGREIRSVYPKAVRQSLAEAYNRGLAKKDFSEFLSIISHKEDKMDKRGDGDFEAIFREISPNKSLFDFTGNQGNNLENYNEKALALSSLVNTRFFTNGKLAKMIKKGEIVQEQFWQLMATANYTETLMKEATPYMDSLRGAQQELLRNRNGLKNDKDVASYDTIIDFLKRVGVAVDSDSLVLEDGRVIDDITLEDAIRGKHAEGYLETEIQRQQEEAEGEEVDTDIKVTKGTFDKRRKSPDEGHLSNSAIRAQMLAGKQTYSVLVAPLIKETLQLLEPGQGLLIRKMNQQEINTYESILPLTEKEDISGVMERVSGYANYMYDLLHPDQNPELRGSFSIDGRQYSQSALAMQHMSQWLSDEFRDSEDYTHDDGVQIIAERLNKSCIEQGAYAEGTTKDFLKSLVVASSNEKLGFDLDSELECRMGGQVGYFFNDTNNPQFSSRERPLFLPLTLVTDNGVYKTSVEYTPQTKQSSLDELLEVAQENVSRTNPEANLRHLTSSNLVVGTNPIFAQALDKYIETQQNENSELSLDKKASLGAKRSREESLPLLYRDLQLYQQYKQQAAQSIKGLIFFPMGSARNYVDVQDFGTDSQEQEPEDLALTFEDNQQQPQQPQLPEESQEPPAEEQGDDGDNRPEPQIGTEEPDPKEILDADGIRNYEKLEDLLEALNNGETHFYDCTREDVNFLARQPQQELSEEEKANIPSYETMGDHFSSREDMLNRVNELLSDGCNLRQAEKIVEYEVQNDCSLVPASADTTENDSNTYESVLHCSVQPEWLVERLSDDEVQPVKLSSETCKFYEDNGVSPTAIEMVEKLMGTGFSESDVEDYMFAVGLPLPDYQRALQQIKEEEQAEDEGEDNLNNNGLVRDYVEPTEEDLIKDDRSLQEIAIDGSVEDLESRLSDSSEFNAQLRKEAEEFTKQLQQKYGQLEQTQEDDGGMEP